MDRCYQGLASLVAEAQAMYEPTKGILEAQPYSSPTVEILGLPTPYRRPIRPDPCLPDGLPDLLIILPWPKPEKGWPELPLILPENGMPYPPLISPGIVPKRGMPFPPPMMPDLPDGIEIRFPGGAPAYPLYVR